jgi:hypothetical protein
MKPNDRTSTSLHLHPFRRHFYCMADKMNEPPEWYLSATLTIFLLIVVLSVLAAGLVDTFGFIH